MRNLFLLILLVTITVSCRDDRDEITSKWKLERITRKGNTLGEEAETVKVDSIFFNFQTNVFLYQRKLPNNNFHTRVSYYRLHNDSITITRISPLKPGEQNKLLWCDSIKSFYYDHGKRNKLKLEDEQYIYQLSRF